MRSETNWQKATVSCLELYTVTYDILLAIWMGRGDNYMKFIPCTFGVREG